MLKKNIFAFIVILSIFILIGSVNAATYGISNSTDSDTISKMISGKIPIKDSKFIKNGDVIKFRAGNYNNLKLIVNKRITITTTKNSKGKVRFIGKNKGIAINLKNNKNKKVNIIGLKISKYDYGIYGKLNSGKISKNLFYKNLNKAIAIKGSKNSITNNKFIKSISGLNIIGNYNKVHYNKIKGNPIGKNEMDFSENGLNIAGNYNSIYKNKIYYFNSGIHIQGNKNIIKKNSAYKCSEGMGFSFGKKNSVSYNRIYHSTNNGIFINDQGSKYSSNKISYSGNSGLVILGSSNNAYKNKVYKNSIGISYLKGNHIFSNILSKNKKNLKKISIESLGEY